jgi:transcriptional regulator with XRE-family HTH domain
MNVVVKRGRLAIADAFREHRKKWIARNPLRIWRKENDISIRMAASMLEVNASTIQDWEGGMIEPNADNMPKIARALSVPRAELDAAWAAWIGAKPSL